MSDPTRFSIFKRRGYYYILYTSDGKIHWKSTRSKVKSEALRALTRFRELTRLKPHQKLLSAFTLEFLAYAEGNYSKGTVTIYRSALARLKSVVGDLPLLSITARHADMFRIERLRTKSPVTVNIDLRTLRAAFNTAVRWQLVERNPFAGVSQARVPETAPSFFTKGDFERLINLVKEPWLKEIIVFAVLTGMRRGEIVNLRWQDVDLARRMLHIQSGDGFTTKHGKRRTIPLGEAATRVLQSKQIRAASDCVFTLNDRKIREGWLSHKFKYWVYEARFKDDRLHFHSLRHTFASWLVQDGVSIFEVQKLLGHSSTAVTQVYSHLQPEQMHETVNRITLN